MRVLRSTRWAKRHQESKRIAALFARGFKVKDILKKLDMNSNRLYRIVNEFNIVTAQAQRDMARTVEDDPLTK